jgi:hypothetical protein
MILTASSSIDWREARDGIDLAAVATKLLGPAPGRRGERGRRLWWSCPFHEDKNPSFCVDPDKAWWKCFGCGAHGDAAALVMKLRGVAFPEAVAFLTGVPAPSGRPAPPGQNPKPPREFGFCPGRPRPSIKPPADAPTEPKGMPEADALALVEAAAARLWTPEGRDALAYLHGRGLTDETIKAARLGWTPGVSVLTREGDRCYRALGVVIPWFSSGRLALVKVRQPEGRKPKYAEVFRDPARLICYPGPETIRTGRPLIVTEGEFDCMLLSQNLSYLDVSVVTLGSASARPGPAALGPMLAAAPWFIATDADEAGDRSASGWPARARRVRPPGGRKDWTGLHLTGFNRLRYLWGGILGRGTTPWSDLATLRWGPARPWPHDGGPSRRRR